MLSCKKLLAHKPACKSVLVNYGTKSSMKSIPATRFFSLNFLSLILQWLESYCCPFDFFQSCFLMNNLMAVIDYYHSDLQLSVFVFVFFAFLYYFLFLFICLLFYDIIFFLSYLISLSRETCFLFSHI